jgi:hypothetical protein
MASSFIGWDPDALVAGIHHHAAGIDSPEPLRRAGPYKFRTLNAAQRETIAVLTEAIIPATDTPGARAARVDEFIDLILTEWSTPEERADFMAGLKAFDKRAADEFGKRFSACTGQQRIEYLVELDNELTLARNARRAWREGNGPRPADHRKLFFHQVRSLTVSGYYSSEPGYTKERKQALIPGIYKACTPAAEA